MSAGNQKLVLVALGVPQLLLAVWAVLDPSGFFQEIADFGGFNRHFVYDYAGFSAAIGLALIGSVWWQSWRVGVLVVATLWSGLHAVNHVVDVSAASSTGLGFLTLGLLIFSTAVYATVTVIFARQNLAQ